MLPSLSGPGTQCLWLLVLISSALEDVTVSWNTFPVFVLGVLKGWT